MMIAVLLTGALVIGGLLAVQASANLQLTKAVGTPYGAATLQLWVAAGLLGILAVATGTFVALTRLGDVPPWYLLGGLASPLYITSGILLFPRIGALAAGGLFVTGQMLASIALDGFGLFGIARQTFGAGTLVGSVAVLAGITAIVRGQRVKVPAAVGLGRPADASASPPLSPAGVTPGRLLLGLLAGAVLPIQGAINARLRTVVVEPVVVALVSFLVAALAITIVFAVLRTTDRTPTPQLDRLGGMPWWGWLGGLCAVGYVTGTFMLLPQIGAAVTVALTVTGQQLASALIDTRGLFRMPQRPFTAARGVGLLLLVAGSVLIQLF
ncbi:DMT family transporter [Pseudonocardia alaniniphila]